MKRKLLPTAIAAISVMCLSITLGAYANSGICLFKKNSSSTKSLQHSIMYTEFSEVSFSQDELIQHSDLIVRGKIAELKETYRKEFKQKPGQPSVVADYSVYNFNVSEVISGKKINENTLNVVFLGTKPESIELNQENVYFLEKDKCIDGAYHLTSYTQGIYNILGQKLINKNCNLKFDKDDLKKKADSILNIK
ncbi:MAG TPA: hypothetical protein VF941_07175 [Clostridia bacterium]